MSKIAALQFPTLSLSESGLDYYLKAAEESGANLIVLGEYVLNSSFNGLLIMPKSMIEEQSEIKKESLESLAKRHEPEVTTPFVGVETKGFRKVCLKVSPGAVKSYEQQILMPYMHWNEAKFFLNKTDRIKLFSFTYEKLKCTLLFGLETHFDLFWQEIRTKKINLVIVPSACTFGSRRRWEELLRTGAFLNQTDILRANCVGNAKHSKEWKFYGDSFLTDAFGEVKNRLGEEEEMPIIQPQSANEAKKIWTFDKIIKDYENGRNFK